MRFMLGKYGYYKAEYNVEMDYYDYFIISSDRLLLRYCNEHSKDIISMVESLNDWFGEDSLLLLKIKEAYANHDVKAIRKLLFNGLNVDITFDYMDVGIGREGKIEARCCKGEHSTEIIFDIKRDKVLTLEDEYSRVVKKFDMCGMEFKTFFFGSGLVGLSPNDLKYFNTNKYIALEMNIDRVKELKFNSIVIDTKVLRNIESLRINRLIQSNIKIIEKCNMRISDAILVNITYLRRSNVTIDNAMIMSITDIRECTVKINKAYRLRFDGGIVDSEIEFNCDLDKDTLYFSDDLNYIRNIGATFIFNKNINIDELVRLINLLAPYVNCTDLKILVSMPVFNKCNLILGGKYMRYIKVKDK